MFENYKDAMDCLMYIELNGVRSGLVERREEYEGCSLYYRGAVPTKTNQRAISNRIIREEEARGFESQGVFRNRIRHYVDGVVIGNKEFIYQQIESLREQRARTWTIQSKASSDRADGGNPFEPAGATRNGVEPALLFQVNRVTEVNVNINLVSVSDGPVLRSAGDCTQMS